MSISTCAFSCAGRRENNEDAYDYKQFADGGVWVVADGLGGHVCGEIASNIATKHVVEAAQHLSFDSPDDEIIRIFSEANRLIVNEQRENPKRKGMRTTIVASFAFGGVMRYAHVGDSRFYYFKNGNIIVQTKDHSVPQMSVQLGEITADQIRSSADRNKLLKALGDANVNIGAIDGKIKLEQGDAFLLCSDGFWELILEREMELDLLKAYNSKSWLDLMLYRVLDRLTERSDNLTAVCGFVV